MQHINYFENPYSVNNMNNNPSVKNENTNKFVSIMEGYLLGNMERGTYIPYKNYKPSFASQYTPKEDLMRTIQAYDFACNDLNLYLDLNPNDQEALTLYRDYHQKLEESMAFYSKQYNPITQDKNVAGTTWKWMKPWPFERGES